MEPKIKFFYPTAKQINPEQRRITVCISRNEIDRDNERIAMDAIVNSFKIYAENPVLFGDHQHRLSTGKSAVIGHGLPETFKIEKDQQGRDCAIVDYVFSITENAETYWVNYRDGHQKAVSMGFIPKTGKTESAKGKSNYVYTDIEWIETSCAGVGSNRGALVRSKGFFDCFSDDEDKSLEIKTLLNEKFVPIIEEILTDKFKIIEQSLDEIKSLLIADPDGLSRGLLLDEDLDELPNQGGEGNNIEHQLERIQTFFKENSNV